MWLQCCQAKLLPSGAVRRSPSIQIQDGHALHERISDRCSVPSGVTTQPGVPRFSTATERSATGTAPVSPASPFTGSPASTTASARSPVRPASAAARSPARISTGRSPAPRTSASGPKASARSRDPGTHSRADGAEASRVASALA